MIQLNSETSVIHHGGKTTVTGSCHELRLTRGSILIDCGLFQGRDLARSNGLAIDFSIENIKALVLTHSHIDHIGRLPWLIAAGFDGPIYCSHATAALAPLMLADGLKLQTGLSKHQREQLLAFIKTRLVGCDYQQWIPIQISPEKSDGSTLCQIRFQPAGHILGSAYIECQLENNEVVVFSGDLGPSQTPLLPDPLPPERADYLFIESTYSNRAHENIAMRKQRLGAICDHALNDGGVIVIPAFSVGRTQELLFDIEQLLHERQLSASLPIILDSPMASQVTQTYREFKALWGREAKTKLKQQRHPLAFDQCIQIEHHRDHLALVNRLANSNESAIVIAASGMCEGGRVVNYLKALLSDSRNDILFAGYQARGTLGDALQRLNALRGDTAKHQTIPRGVEIDGKWYEVNAQIHTMSGYSAHADKHDLERFIDGITPPPKAIHLIHGEPDTQRAFAHRLKRKDVTNIIS
ncbi:MBL fold metallo-hydrolase [Vibrio sp. SM6]|uniref:MBL fold metallo-hydrolase n=1 Tax=Vibrio agarilyticus TaxID=2726741 RepID=A0A7X8TRL7_9VIBR|nr:MBL fold metallo-hydrolase [Vibrio agarilyticus]NLS13515.1 MBL fold metallo-hydrolase [Vibrio agarilyticus]